MADELQIHATAINESNQVGSGTRIWAFAHVMPGAVIGRNCNIGNHAFIESGAVLGDGVTVKNGVSIWNGIVLEDYVFVGPNAVFTNDLTPRSPRDPALGARYADKTWLKPSVIRHGASIGANATLLCGLAIGTYAMVAAGAIVTRDVPDYTLVAGCPARIAGYVCVCGTRLHTPQDGSASCPHCNRTYHRDSSDRLCPDTQGYSS